jgi:FKBP-type peptidyl-prolyl cis-trans isomerase FklB
MKIRHLFLTAALVAGFSAQAQKAPVSSKDITFDKNKTSYAMGFQLGRDLAARKGTEFELSMEEVLKGVKDAYAGKEPAYAKEDLIKNMTAFEQKMRARQIEAFKKVAEENKKRSEKFLAQNRKKKGIKELPSGVQYRVIEEGSGKHPTADSEVTIHYRGSLIGKDNFDNLREFDSSFIRGVPRTFKVNEVLKGWQEVLPLMKTGAKWQVFIPPELAYGIRGQGPIGPNEVLVFDINLLDVK